jgi:PEGA domain
MPQMSGSTAKKEHLKPVLSAKLGPSRLEESDFQPESAADPGSSNPFKSEEQLARAAAARQTLRYTVYIAGFVFAAAAIGLASWYALREVRARQGATVAAAAEMGTALFKSSPDGATILVDGVHRGTTPIKLSLTPGSHTVTITSGETSRSLPLTVEAGLVISHYVELAVPPPAAGGRVEVSSDPSGAEVRIDGTVRGTTPLVITDLSVGSHKVTVSSGETVINRTVNVTQGTTASVLVSTGGAPSSSAAGWLTLEAPFELDVYEGAQLIGTSRTGRLMLPVGSHDLDLTNAALEFSAKRNVKIAPGKTATLSLTSPIGRLSVNAVPWAEVSVDGRPVGTTPLGNVSVPIGAHEILFRHPQLGERRQTVTIKSQSPTRVGMDLTR